MTGESAQRRDNASADRAERFGEFLIRRGDVTPEAREAALAKQHDLNARLGVLAMDKDLLLYEDVRAILAEQERTGDLFGRCAVRLGLLDAIQVDGLLTIQADARMRLGQVLVISGVLTPAQLEAALEAYRAATAADESE